MRPVSTNLNEGKYKLYTGHSQCTYLRMLAIRRISYRRAETKSVILTLLKENE